MNIIHNLTIKATPLRLYEGISTKDGLAGWYTPYTEAGTKVGSLVELTFPSETTLTFRVETLETDRQVEWSGVDVPPDWKGTRLKFDITPKGDLVGLTFTHLGLPAHYEDFGCFNYLWGQYLRSLKLLVETGTGEPYGSRGSKLAGTTPA